MERGEKNLATCILKGSIHPQVTATKSINGKRRDLNYIYFLLPNNSEIQFSLLTIRHHCPLGDYENDKTNRDTNKYK